MLAARVNGLTAAEATTRTAEVLAAFDLTTLADR